MFSCEASFPGCDGTFALRVLEFLHTYPNTHHRAALIEHVIDTSVGRHRLQYEWLVEEWIDQALVQPFQAAGGLPDGFAESWPRGAILPADLDNNGAPDYVVTVNSLSHTDALLPHRLYWLFPQNGRWQQELLIQDLSAFRLDLLSTQDVNGDGQADLAYTLTHYGASDRSDYLYLFTRQESNWQRLPVLTQYGHNVPAQNGGWSFTFGTDKGVELNMRQGGTGSSSGPTLSYDIHFIWQRDAFIPVNISPIENNLELHTLKIQWADRLVASQQFTETLPVLNEILAEKGRWKSDDLYRPFVWFRLMMAHLYLEQPAEAHEAWTQLVEEYPDMASRQDASQLETLIDQPQPAWKICDWYLRERPDWSLLEIDTSAYHFSYGEGYPFDVYTWCDPWLLVTLPTWVREQSLEEQAARLGLDWQLLSDAYDLNDDGVNDPLVALEEEAWAFLSAGERYHPLYAESWLPLGAIREPFRGLPGNRDERTLQVADLDRNGMPEIWVLDDSRVLAWLWQGWHFEGQWQQFFLGDKGYWGRARLADGAIRVRIAEYPYSEDRVIGELVFQLVDGRLQRIDPPVQKERSMNTLSAAVEALYHQNDPRQTLQLLENFTPQTAEYKWDDDPTTPDWSLDADWELAAACALRALAYEHLGDKEAAMQEWQLILQKYPEPAWVGLAEDIGGLEQ